MVPAEEKNTLATLFWQAKFPRPAMWLQPEGVTNVRPDLDRELRRLG